MLAFAPIFSAQSAFAQTQTEYNAQVAQAQADVDTAQTALQVAQDALAAAQQLQTTTISAVSNAQQVLQNNQAILQEKTDAVATAKLAVDQAQSNYDNSLIDDPTWTPLTQEVAHTRMVSHTEMVAHTISVPHTTTTVIGGVTAEVFNRLGYNNAPPLPSANEVPYATMTVSDINFQWGNGPILGTDLSEDVIVKFTGNLLFPQDGMYKFYTPADDGTKLNIAGMDLINDWRDKGGGGTTSQEVFIRGGVLYPFTLYYYENGGGAWVQMFYYTQDSGYTLVPSSYLGAQIQEETTYTEETVWIEETVWTEETFFTTEVIPNQVAPQIKNEALLALIDEPTTIYNNAVSDYQVASTNLDTANTTLKQLQDQQLQNQVTIDVAQQSAQTKQEELDVAKQKLAAIPPFKDTTPTPETTTEPTKEPTTPVVQPTPEPITPTPSQPDQPKLPVDITTVNPQELTTAQVTELISVANEILNNSEQGSPVYEQALEALFVAAKADDIQLDPSLAAVPGLSAAVDAINFMGNVGSDMSPKVRTQSKKIVVTAVVAVGAAVNAATGAALMATPSAGGAPTSGSSSTGYRRRKD